MVAGVQTGPTVQEEDPGYHKYQKPASFQVLLDLGFYQPEYVKLLVSLFATWFNSLCLQNKFRIPSIFTINLPTLPFHIWGCRETSICTCTHRCTTHTHQQQRLRVYHKWPSENQESKALTMHSGASATRVLLLDPVRNSNKVPMGSYFLWAWQDIIILKQKQDPYEMGPINTSSCAEGHFMVLMSSQGSGGPYTPDVI